MTSLPLSLINDYLFCPRRAGLKILDGVRSANEHTLLGDQAHEHVDFPGYEQRAGWTLLRALPVFSDKLHLSGKADLVEVHRDASGNICEARPIEYKKGPKRKFDNDSAQLCAQALCIEEMLGISVPVGAVYHVQSERRTEVVFDAALRQKTHATIQHLHELLLGTGVSDSLPDTAGWKPMRPVAPALPPAILRPQCEGCSLHEICLPEAPASAASRTCPLFEPREY